MDCFTVRVKVYYSLTVKITTHTIISYMHAVADSTPPPPPPPQDIHKKNSVLDVLLRKALKIIPGLEVHAWICYKGNQ